MNEIAKRAAVERLKKAMELEQLRPLEVAKLLNLSANYISMFRNESHWNKLPRYAWDRLVEWINHGTTLRQFKIPESEPLRIIEIPDKPKTKQPEIKKPELKKEIQVDAKITKIDLVKSIKEPENEGLSKEEYCYDSEYIEEINAVRLKIALDLEVNFIINGQKMTLK